MVKTNKDICKAIEDLLAVYCLNPTEALYNTFVKLSYPITMSLLSYYSHYYGNIMHTTNSCLDLAQSFYVYFNMNKLNTYRAGSPFYLWFKMIVYHFYIRISSKIRKEEIQILNTIEIDEGFQVGSSDGKLNELLKNEIKQIVGEKLYTIYELKNIYNLPVETLAEMFNCSTRTIIRYNNKTKKAIEELIQDN